MHCSSDCENRDCEHHASNQLSVSPGINMEMDCPIYIPPEGGIPPIDVMQSMIKDVEESIWEDREKLEDIITFNADVFAHLFYHIHKGKLTEFELLRKMKLYIEQDAENIVT